MRSLLLLLLVLLTLAAASAITLVGNGQPTATIVVAVQTDPKVKAAAEELQQYLAKISGATLPIATDADNPTGALVLVGRSKLTDAMGIAIPAGVTPIRKEEGFVIACRDDRLVLAGNNEAEYHGTEYAVADFLERLGVRWFMPTDFGEIVPKMRTVTFADVDISEKPDFCVRGWEVDEKWGIRNKLGVAGDFGAADTSVWYYMPPFEERPELYALGPDGKRDKNLGICYSNPETAKAVAERLVAAFKKDSMLNVIGIAPPDGAPACSCPYCKKASQGFPNGAVNNSQFSSNTEEWIGFVQRVAALVRKECPDRYIWTNGYSNRHFAPQGFDRLEPNVGVMFAAIEDCTMHALDAPNCWQKQAQAKTLQRWCALTGSKVTIYDYILQMMVSSLTPVPMVHKYRHDMPLWKRWGVMGYTLCTRNCWAEEGILTKYLRAKLAWDADADAEAIMRDFYDKWYGRTARPMRAYWEALDRAIEQAPFHGHENTFMPEVYTPALMVHLEKSLAEGEKAAASERDRLHVHLDRLIHEHLKAYVAMEAADDECDYAECICQAERMLDLRKQINDLTGFPSMMTGEYAYTTEDRIKEWQGWLDKTNGKAGSLVAILPAEAKFKTDPHAEGYHFQWYNADLNEKGWKPILTTRGWEAQGYQDKRGFNYTGLAWYRMNADVPADAAGKQIILLMPGEVEEAWCWVNGHYAGHFPPHSVWWRQFTHEFDVTGLLKSGQNQLTVRVLCNEQYFGVSGIFRRMLLYSPAAVK